MEDEQPNSPPAPDPRLVAVQDATAALMAACNHLPDNAYRGHALAQAATRDRLEFLSETDP